MQSSKTPTRSGNYGWAGGSDSQLTRTGLNSPQEHPIGKAWLALASEPIAIQATAGAVLFLIVGIAVMAVCLRRA